MGVFLSIVVFCFCLVMFGNVAALEIILSLCFDRWKKCTTFANVKVCKTQACVPVKTFE